MDLETAIDLADYFTKRGNTPSALLMLKAVLKADPHRDDIRRRHAEMLWSVEKTRLPRGTLQRGRTLLQLMGFGVLTRKLEAAYFDNLEQVLSRRERRAVPGSLVLGLGSGRCGSTSLTGSFARLPECCATHENPPLVHWPPEPQQIRFHIKRFRLLLDRFRLVFDSAHWWLNATDELIDAFGGIQFIGLMRDPETCARSFLNMKGVGRGSINHWVDHDGSFWRPARWDRLYPSYDVDLHGLGAIGDVSEAELRRRQFGLVQTYVEDYNRSLRSLKDKVGERLLLVRTEEIGDPDVQTRIGEFAGVEIPPFDGVLNRGSTTDGEAQAMRY